MLSRAILPLTRPNVLASTVRASALSTQRPRWYAKTTGDAPYKLPKSLRSQSEMKKSGAANDPQPEAEAPEPSSVR